MIHERDAYAGISGGIEDRNDCAVRSVALACGIPYAEAQRRLMRAGRRRHAPASLDAIEAVLVELGRARGAWMPHRPMALRRFVRERAGTWIFFVHRHVAVLKDGIVYDWKPRPGETVELAWRIN